MRTTPEAGRILPGNNLEAGDLLEVTEIAGEHCIALLDRGDGDQQIVKRECVSFRCLLAFDLTDQPRGLFRRRMDGNQVNQFFDIFPAALGCF